MPQSQDQNTDLRQDLIQLQRRHALILECAGEGIYGLDDEGLTTFVNPTAAKMLGWEVEELIGTPQHAVIHHTRPDGSEYPRERCPIYAAFKDGKVHRVDDEVFWRKDGTCFPVEYVSTPIHAEGGKLLGAVVTFNDISERKRQQAALEQALAQVQRLTEQMYSLLYSDKKSHFRGRTHDLSHFESQKITVYHT